MLFSFITDVAHLLQQLSSELYDRGSIPGSAGFFLLHCVQTGSGAHPASCTMDTGGPFPGAKARPGLDADHSPPSSVEVENE
jgi:hypothetical protein